MAEPKTKPERRVAGKSKFRLPERPPRVVETNPLREILQEAKAQEEALKKLSPQAQDTPAKRIAGVGHSLKTIKRDTPAQNIAGVSVFLLTSDVVTAVGPGSGWLRRQKETKDSSLLGWRIKDFRSLNKA